MVHSHNLADAIGRDKIVEQWNPRLDALAKKDMLRSQFCRKHGIDPSQLSRHCSGRKGASWEMIDVIEKALLKEEDPKKEYVRKSVEKP